MVLDEPLEIKGFCNFSESETILTGLESENLSKRGIHMSKKVLIVDDAAFMRMMLKDILQKNDFEVVAEAENGKVGVAAYQKFKPDIVTMDITMPEMNGIDAVKAIKALDADAKIVMVSAMGQQPMVIEAIQAGANDFIVKPFQPERVIEAISKVLA